MNRHTAPTRHSRESGNPVFVSANVVSRLPPGDSATSFGKREKTSWHSRDHAMEDACSSITAPCGATTAIPEGPSPPLPRFATRIVRFVPPCTSVVFGPRFDNPFTGLVDQICSTKTLREPRRQLRRQLQCMRAVRRHPMTPVPSATTPKPPRLVNTQRPIRRLRQRQPRHPSVLHQSSRMPCLPLDFSLRSRHASEHRYLHAQNLSR